MKRGVPQQDAFLSRSNAGLHRSVGASQLLAVCWDSFWKNSQILELRINFWSHCCPIDKKHSHGNRDINEIKEDSGHLSISLTSKIYLLGPYVESHLVRTKVTHRTPLVWQSRIVRGGVRLSNDSLIIPAHILPPTSPTDATESQSSP